MATTLLTEQEERVRQPVPELEQVPAQGQLSVQARQLPEQVLLQPVRQQLPP
ncbi:MAG: hypothetical protein L3J49_01530 [Desulfobulbaceae bacterium]|nr:hypothetical protein [Desulfobulbaceae bacterium]